MAVVRGLFGATVVGGLLWAAPALAQTGTVNGRVVDSTTQQPLGGATIRLEGTQRGAQTREDGSFTLTAVPTGRQSLRVSRIGYAAQLSPVTVNEGANTLPPIRLRQLAATLAPVVAVGYGTQRREATTSSVATINTSEARVGVQPNVNNLLQGRAAGVQVTSNSGDPGAGAQIRVRGGTSITSSNEPLYVIDGIPLLNNATTTPGPGTDPTNAGTAPLNRSPLNSINPEDIADISILKDAAATAIYGSRAANGVVLITTKRGVAGTSTAEYDGYYAAGTQARKYDLLSGDQYRAFIAQQVAAGNLPASAVSANGTANTDWQSAIGRTANIQNHNVAISGGSQTTQYRASVNYFDNPAVIQGSYLTRIAGRLNGSTRLLGDKLNLNVNLNPSQERDRYLIAENTGGFTGGTFLNTLTFNPTFPVKSNQFTTGYFEQGTGAVNNRNPVALANNLQDRATITRVIGNVQAAYAFLPSLTGTVNVGVDQSAGNRGSFYPNSNPLGAQFGGLAQQGQLNATTQTINTFLTYDKQFNTGLFGQQSFNIVGGYEYQRSNIAYAITRVQNLLSDAVGYNSLGAAGTVLPPTSADSIRNTVSYFARATYGIKDRYFINGLVRRDGASVFGANNKYATFPGGSLSWVMSNEPWFRNNGLFQNLKFRASYGTSGVQAINPYQSLTLLGFDPASGYAFGGGVSVNGAVPFQIANPNLKWQTTVQTDAGIDFGVLKNRVTGTLDFYSKTTRDLLYAVSVPQPAVVTTQLQNIGKIKNAGLEGSLDGQVINQPGKSLSLGFVFSVDRNRVVSLGNSVQQIFTGTASGAGQSNVNTQVIQVGQPLGTFYGPVFAGTQAVTVTNSDGTSRTDSVAVYNHYDANGKVTGQVQQGQLGAYDNRLLGNGNPKFTTGFRGQGNLGRAYINFLVRAQTGQKIFNNTRLVYATKSGAAQGQNFLASALTDGTSLNQAPFFSSRYVENGSFIRLQNVTVGYDLNVRSVIRRVTSARVYVSGDNLLLGTHYSGLDPEVFTSAGISSIGIDYLTFPRARTFTFGTRLGF